MTMDAVARQYIRLREWSRLPFTRAEGNRATLSAKFQHRHGAHQGAVTSAQCRLLETALTEKMCGNLEPARQHLQALRADPGTSGPLRGEVLFQLGEIAQYQQPAGDEWRALMTAATTFQENHPSALAALNGELSRDPGAADAIDTKDAPRILLVLGSNFATVAFANEIMKALPVVGILQQYAEFPVLSRSLRPQNSALPAFGLTADEALHFADENAVLGNAWNALFADRRVPHSYLTRGEANIEATLDWVTALRPDLIISHGPERLSQEFIDCAPLGGINVHWGLSPTYRGMHTVRWPLLEQRAEWVGLTVHKLDPGLDSGEILYQARPKVKAGDTMRRVEYRLTELASDIVVQSVREISSKAARPVPQHLERGRHFWLRDWAPAFDDRLTPEYIADQFRSYHDDQAARDAGAPLINPWPKS